MKVTDKKLVSQGSIYFLGNILRHTISFIMLPIYTRVLTPADYGTIELLSMVIDFSGVIFGLKIGEAIFRFYFETDDKSKKNEVISSALILACLFNGIGFLLIISISGPITSFLFGNEEYSFLLILFSLTLFVGPLNEIPMTLIRGQQRPWMFVNLSALKTTIQLTLNIYLVVYKHMGVTGVILSAVISSSIMALILGSYCLLNTGLQFSIKRAKSLVLFSYPMVLASLISFYITFGDRYFLKLYGTLSDVGIYALAYKFGFLFTFIGTGPFFSIWDTELYNVLKRSDAKETFQRIFIFFTGLSLLFLVVLSIFSKNILILMASPEFWKAAEIVPIILFAYFLQGWTVFCSLGILVEKKTFIITKSTIVVAVVITALYILLIPEYGSRGAAWATLIAFAVRFLYIQSQSKKLYDMELQWGKVIKLFPPCIVAILIGHFGPDFIFYSLPINIGVIVVLLYTATILPVFTVNQRQVLRHILNNPWKLPNLIRGVLKNV